MQALLAELGDPQLAFPAVHVVGTNGKSTDDAADGGAAPRRRAPRGRLHVAARRRLARAAGHGCGGLRAGGRARAARGRPAGRDPVRDADRRRARRVRRRRGRRRRRRGGARRAARRDERPPVAPVVVLTNVGLEHTEQLGETREEIAAEKLAVVQAGAAVALGEWEWEALARSSWAETSDPHRPEQPRARGRRRRDVPRPTRWMPRRADGIVPPGPARAPGRGAARDLGRRAQPRRASAGSSRGCPTARYVVVVLDPPRQGRRRDAGGALGCSATRWSRPSRAAPRALPAAELASACRADGSRERRTERDPVAALAAARAIAGPDGAVLVDGLAVPARRPRRRADEGVPSRPGTRVSVYVFAAIVIAALCRNRVRRGVRRGKAPPVTP